MRGQPTPQIGRGGERGSPNPNGAPAPRSSKPRRTGEPLRTHRRNRTIGRLSNSLSRSPAGRRTSASGPQGHPGSNAAASSKASPAARSIWSSSKTRASSTQRHRQRDGRAECRRPRKQELIFKILQTSGKERPHLLRRRARMSARRLRLPARSRIQLPAGPTTFTSRLRRSALRSAHRRHGFRPDSPAEGR